ncbi:DUF2878 family protein [Pseudomonas sp. Gutcm_11s]|uniref:DUF2878 family protein n=1 Tax=Pseudomonas sp. Gutcm_11s TaxID=3026088 RepID=UPI00235FD2D8|nr:DUF2878 family protein [Pseudomonas sp. Gutcm_11s]MDD0841666.1 DUF2878 family protein [Pseudomonas sp. Gutcm_11s]
MNGRLLLNAGLFQLGWWACVLSPQHPWLLALAPLILASHLIWLAQPGEWRGVLAVTLLGTVLDALLASLGLFDFSLPPLWLILLWPLLACTLSHSLAWSAHPRWRAALLGALAAPPAYIAGASLAGVGLPLGVPLTWLLLAALWAGVLPLCQRLMAN